MASHGSEKALEIAVHAGIEAHTMNRRRFVRETAALVIASGLPRGSSTLPHAQTSHYYQLAAAVIPRHRDLEEIKPVLARYKERGYTGIWVENDYLGWRWDAGPDQGYLGDWKLFDIFDFILGASKTMYQDYLARLCAMCSDCELDFYSSFWMPQLGAELRNYLQIHNPQALGSCMWHGARQDTLCTCQDGAGLNFLREMVASYLLLSPSTRGFKVATLDNKAYICDETCPHAHGTTRAQHIGNLYGVIQKALRKERSDSSLFVYEWFWEPGYLAEVQKHLSQPYFLICKMEVNTRQNLEASIPGEPLFDASNLTGEEGPNFKEAVDAMGAKSVVDMPAMGSGIDDFFLGSPPIPGRIHRRFRLHRSIGCDKLIEFDCGGHWDDSCERAFAIFNVRPDISETDLLRAVATDIYRREDARGLAIEGWSEFDRGYEFLPVGLGDTQCTGMSGRFGLGWNMCLATPLVRDAFSDADQHDRIHWFSPYNLFLSGLVDRLETQFLRVQSHWQRAWANLAAAAALENYSSASVHEAVSAEGQVLAVESALNWCNACRYARDPAREGQFRDVCQLEIDLTKRFLALSSRHGWLWNHICWHPHKTPMSQRGLGFEGLKTQNTFEAKLAIMGAGE
jgi:hypothetical protein